MKKIKHWLKKLVVDREYKKAIEKFGSEGDWEEMENMENFLKSCKISITDYRNCEEIPITLGLRIKYGNKEFFFYERESFGLEKGARQYDMKYDGSGMTVNNLEDDK